MTKMNETEREKKETYARDDGRNHEINSNTQIAISIQTKTKNRNLRDNTHKKPHAKNV